MTNIFQAHLPSLFSKAVRNIIPDNDKLDNQFEKYNFFADNYDISQPVFIRNNIHFISLENNNPTLRMKWLTISHQTVIFENMRIQARIQVTASGKIIAKNCTFEPYNTEDECIIEIFAKSNGHFENCEINNANKVGMIVRNSSKCNIQQCQFNNEKAASSILVLDQAHAMIKGSYFSDVQKFSVYVLKSGNCEIDECKFENPKALSIFLFNQGQATVSNCNFSNCQSCITLSQLSKLDTINCNFSNVKIGAISIRDSVADIKECSFSNSNCNGIVFNNSNGNVYDVTFKNFELSPIAVLGNESKPFIKKANIMNVNNSAIISRDYSQPIFENITIDNVKSNGASISDFSTPVFRNCKFSNVSNDLINIFNGAKATFDRCNMILNENQQQYLMNISLEASIETFTNNIIEIPFHQMKDKIIYVHHNGISKINCFENNQIKYTKCKCNSGRAFHLSDYKNCILQAQSSQHLHKCHSHNHECKCNSDHNNNESHEKQILCMHCQENLATQILIPCGHKVLCEKCANIIKNDKENQKHQCPLCNTCISDSTIEYKENCCVICLDAACDCIFLPCGHRCVCSECAKEVMKNQSKCPLCQRHLKAFKHCFEIPEEPIVHPINQTHDNSKIFAMTFLDFLRFMPFSITMTLFPPRKKNVPIKIVLTRYILQYKHLVEYIHRIIYN